MARFYARFDHDTIGSLDNSGFDRRVIGSQTSSAEATGYNSSDPDLRGGLITSRSILSDAMKAQLDYDNENGSLGPIIPPSKADGSEPNITRSGGDFSWSKVYTTIGNQIPGIKTPSNFSTRPTSSVFTDDGNITATVPDDPGTISDSLYVAATSAVDNVVNSIKKVEGSLPYSTNGSPFIRLGLLPSRTLHSLYHDSSLEYFAWDDFTPGLMNTSGMEITTVNSKCNGTNNVTPIAFKWANSSFEFKNDRNGSAKIGIQIRISANGTSGTCTTDFTSNYRLQLGYSATTHGGPLTIGNGSSGNGPTNPSGASGCTGTSTWTYSTAGVPTLTWNVKLPDCSSPGYNIDVSVTLFDVTITTNSNGGQPGIISTDLTVSI